MGGTREKSQVDLSTGSAWRKSSASGEDSNNCVEVAGVDLVTLVRDSKFRTDVLMFRPGEWRRFLNAVPRLSP
jgi:hypothetical protein